LTHVILLLLMILFREPERPIGFLGFSFG
jgi:hypothetical protein